MRKIFILIASLITIGVNAQTYLQEGMKEALKTDLNLSGCNLASYFHIYDYLNSKGLTAKTPSPEGYEAFYISTFARHGSRWLGSAKQYDDATNVLVQAEKKGVLTEKGKELLRELKQFRTLCPNNMFGQLTKIGAEQHRSIARRMVANFPEIFNSEGHFFAQSSTVKRCVESMNAEAQIIDSVTGLHIKQVRGPQSRQQRLAGRYKGEGMDAQIAKSYPYYGREQNSLTPTKRLSELLFTNTSWTTQKVLGTFVRDLFNVISSTQNVDDNVNLWKWFTVDEVNNLWEIKNRLWYRMHGPSPTSGGMGPVYAKWTMEDFVEDADTIVNRKNWHGGNLRFGHDLTVAPLTCLMELGTSAQAISEEHADTINKVWRVQEISPMAGNIQLVFYRPKNGTGDILVKAMVNEVEVTMPGKPVVGKYYRWTEIRKKWLDNKNKK